MKVHLTLRNQGGSVEHYWHFFMGYFLPLLNYYDSLGHRSETAEILVRSCGPMDRHLADLKWLSLKVLPKMEHEALRSAASSGLQYVSLAGMDSTKRFRGRLFRKAVRFLERKWKKEGPLVPRHNRVLIIERGEPDPFYLSQSAEIAASGILRRSIPNMSQILECIRNEIEHVEAVQLEKLPLREQFELYRGAELILYQHGASMANLVFSRKGARVIEILPETLQPEVREMANELCQITRLRYCRIRQESEHCPVEPGLVLKSLQAALT